MVTRIFAGKKFNPYDTIEVKGQKWDVGIITGTSEANGRPLSYPIAFPPSREYGIALIAERVSPNGEVELFSTHKEWANGTAESVQNLDGNLENVLLEQAQDRHAYFMAVPSDDHITFSGDNDTRVSHKVKLGDVEWVIGARKMNEDGKWIATATDVESDPKIVIFFAPHGMEPDGAIQFQPLIASEAAPEAREIKDEDNIPPRLLNELEWFANRYQYFGSIGEQRDILMDELGDAALVGVDMDLELASLLKQEHATGVEVALETGDKEAFRSHSEKLKTASEAVEILQKPKGHHERVAKQESWSEAVAQSGDSKGLSL